MSDQTQTAQDSGTDGAEKSKKKDKQPNKATRAVELAGASGGELWHDPDNEAWCDVRSEDGVRRTLRVRSRAFRTWLSGLMYRSEGSALGGQAATDAVDVLTAMAVHDAAEREVHVRLAHHDDDLYLDLGDDTWGAVHIERTGWSIVATPPVRFRRPGGLRPIPSPSTSDADGWTPLRELLHLEDGRDWILLVSWLVGALHPSGPYPVLALTGEQGSAKTTVGRLLRSIIDPSEAPLRSPPREDRELVIAARNSHVLGLDNLSRIQEWLSDGLCRISTGSGYSARKLYSDGEEVIYSDQRPIILTSISDVATRGDLADRAVAVCLPRIPEHARRTARDVQADMDSIRPGVVAALLDAVSTGLRRLPKVKLDRLPRMADFAQWVVACEPDLPWKDGAFLEAYADAREEMVETSIEADAVATAILDMVKDSDSGAWSGTATELLAALNRRQEGKPPRHWPETPQAMGGRITRAAPLVRAAGWNIERGAGRDRRTTFITPHEHSSASERHERHTSSHPNDGAGSERDNMRDDGDDRDEGGDEGRHADSPTRTRDVTTRDDGDDVLHTRTNGADATENGDPPEELSEEDRQHLRDEREGMQMEEPEPSETTPAPEWTGGAI